MSLPVILVNSTGGSDTQASGAGPATALFGTTDASFSGATVTLTAGTDLTNVAVDGSHVLYLLTSTGVRFFKITAKAGSGGATPTVDVTPSPAGTSTGRTWAIGGKRASLASASSKLLVDNGGAAGDAGAGWIIEMQSGHAESISAAIDLRRAGDTTSGRLIIRGESGAATLPKITVTANVNAFVTRASYNTLRDFEIEAASSAVTSAVVAAAGANNTLRGLVLSRTSTNVFTTGFDFGTNNLDVTIMDCEVQRCGVGIKPPTGLACVISGCYIHDCTSHGIDCSTSELGLEIVSNTIARCGGDGIRSAFAGVNTARSLLIFGNTIDACTSDGIEFTAAPVAALQGVSIINNILSNNGGYGLNFSNGGSTLIALQTYGLTVRNNNTYNNTSGPYLPASLGEDDPAVNPDYVNASAGDFTPQAATLEGTQYPVTIP